MLPGLPESLPLILFGLASVGLAVYSLVEHSNAFGTRVPLWTFLAGLGGIALAGGLASAALGEELENLPRAGDHFGTDLIVVPLTEWRALRATAELSRRTLSPSPPPRARRTLSPSTLSDASSPATPTAGSIAPPAPVPARPPMTPPEWWDDALRAAQEDGLLVAGPRPDPSEPSDFREVLDTLDSLSGEAMGGSAARSPNRARAASAESAGDVGERPGRGRPPSPHLLRSSARADPAAALDDLRAELDSLSPAASPSPLTVSRSVLCAGCGASVAAQRDGAANCSSCDRPLCRACLDRAVAEDRLGLCPRCAMLSEALDG